MRALLRTAGLLGLVALGACATTGPQEVPRLASARITPDFESYHLNRVGLVPVFGDGVTQAEGIQLQDALLAELMASVDFEVVELRMRDLSETPTMEAWNRGWYRPESILDLSRRHTLDGILVAVVTDRQTHPPQRLGMQVDLVSSETGQTIWHGRIHIDASEARVRDAMKIWSEERLGDVSEHSWETVLIAPTRFARFASFQLASLL